MAAVGEVGEAEPEGVDIEDGAEEAVGVRVADRVDRPPSDAERRAHCRTHLPFRSWCSICVQGRAADAPHRRGLRAQEEPQDAVSFDYCFLRDFSAGDYISMLVGRDRRTNMLLTHVVPMKGACVEWLIPQVVRDLERLGYYNMVTLKSDGEHALVDVMRAVAQARGDTRRTVLEFSLRRGTLPATAMLSGQ